MIPSDGQSLVEFALVLPILLLVLLGILQVGIIFGSQLVLSGAVEQGTQQGVLYQYNLNLSQTANDQARASSALAATESSMAFLSTSTPYFNPSTDFTVSYANPFNVALASDRSGQTMTVSATYHLQLIIPLVGHLMTSDPNGYLPLTVSDTMVIH